VFSPRSRRTVLVACSVALPAVVVVVVGCFDLLDVSGSGAEATPRPSLAAEFDRAGASRPDEDALERYAKAHERVCRRNAFAE